MNNSNLRIHRCFNFQVWDSQKASVETWIQDDEYSSENIDKTHTEFHKVECKRYKSSALLVFP